MNELADLLSAHLAPGEAERLANQVARLPDPRAALEALRQLPPERVPLDAWRLRAFLTITGSSPFLGHLLRRDPGALDVIPAGGPPRGPRTREDLEEDLARFQALHATDDASTVLRRFKQREYLRIALLDLLGTTDLPAVTRALSLLADVLLDRAIRIAWSRLEARFGRPISRDDQGHPEDATFTILALGKLGGEELNYSSDIDLLYLFSRDGETTGMGRLGEGVIGNRAFFTRLAGEVTHLIAGEDPEGQVFRVDLGLRPGGRDGNLVISLSAAVAYYGTWAQAWERQALIKARPAAGDRTLGHRFLLQVEKLVYSRDPDPYLALEIGAMKDRIDARLSAEGRADVDIKLGRGGIREIEFATQALQLMRGGGDHWLREGNTLLALHRLADKGYVAYEEYAALARAYVFLRHLEHRLQLGEDRQTATLPTSESALQSLARSMPLGEVPRGGETDALLESLEAHRRTVRAFYDSVVGRAAQRGLEEARPDPWLDRMDDDALTAILHRSGLPHPEVALRPVKTIRRHLQAAAASQEIRRALQKAGPSLLQEVARTPHPRRTLDNLEKLLASVAVTPERLLRFVSRRESLAPIVRLLGRSDFLAGLLIRQPAILMTLEDRGRILRTPDAAATRRKLRAAERGRGDARRRAGRLRRLHQEALATIALRDINRQATLREVLKSLSDLADATVDEAAALTRPDREHGSAPGSDHPRLAVLALGRLGYRELDYGSDLDLIFVHEGAGEGTVAARAAASRWCGDIVRTLSTLSRDGQLYRVDLRLRPSGREGDLVVSADGLRDYFLGSAEVWEMQSFLKARPIAGDLDLGRRVVETIEAAILERAREIDSRSLAISIAAMGERLQRGPGRAVEGSPSIKLGEGGILEVHFIIEFLQLRHAVRNPEDKDTLRLLTLLQSLGHLPVKGLRVLYEGYLFLRALEHEMRLIHDPPLERLPDEPHRLQEIALALDPAASDGSAAARRLVEAFKHQTQSIRSIFEQVVRA